MRYQTDVWMQVAHFKQLLEMNFFDGSTIYRAEKGFVLQGGPTMLDGSKKPSPLKNLMFEFG